MCPVTAGDSEGVRVAEAVPWREAMRQALYGERGFFVAGEAGSPPGAHHFRTSARASPLFATAILRLVAPADEALERPDPLDVVDVGAGPGDLLRRIAVLAPTYLQRRLRLRAVELAPPPADLPRHIEWLEHLPEPGSTRGILLATEWLDNVPLDIAEADERGRLHYMLVDPDSGTEWPGPRVDDADEQWAARWWSRPPWSPGTRIELGASRDEAWAAAVRCLDQGLALTVDYGHIWGQRPATGTLTGYLAGREVDPVPDGSRDITAHVAIDAVGAAGERVARRRAVRTSQREALLALGLDGTRPPRSLASQDPIGYVRALSAATEAAELLDPYGLGGHHWLVQPVGLPATLLPTGLRPRLPS